MEANNHRPQALYPAQELTSEQRKQLAINLIRQGKPVTHLANEENVSRNFLYKQKLIATSAIDQAFEKKEKNDKVLFYIPVTKAWLWSIVLLLIFHCRSSYRGVIKFFADAFDQKISPGTISNILQDTISKASIINAKQDLSNIRHPALDEMFQGNKPILTGVDTLSLYCHLLSKEDHRDSDTWAIHLWDLMDQGFNPDYTIADFAGGIRDGQATACPNIPCNGDVYHICQMLQKLKRFFANRAKSSLTALNKVNAQMEKAKEQGNAQQYSKKLAIAREKERKYRELLESISILVGWMQHDVLKIEGLDPKSRRDLYDFIVDEFKKLESIHSHRIRPVRIALENQGNKVLAFVDVLNEKLKNLSQKYNVPLYLLWDLCELQRYSQESTTYHEKAVPLKRILKHKFYNLQNDVLKAMQSTPKASSAVENFHSRLSNYFFLRKEVGNKYLELLRFYLNHTPFLRSARPEREGKTPAELLTGKQHPHWLEMLGYDRFQAAA